MNSYYGKPYGGTGEICCDPTTGEAIRARDCNVYYTGSITRIRLTISGSTWWYAATIADDRSKLEVGETTVPFGVPLVTWFTEVRNSRIINYITRLGLYYTRITASLMCVPIDIGSPEDGGAPTAPSKLWISGPVGQVDETLFSLGLPSWPISFSVSNGTSSGGYCVDRSTGTSYASYLDYNANPYSITAYVEAI